MVDLFEPEFFQERFHFFLLPACWHNENHHLHGDFQVKKEIQCNSGAYT